MNQLSAHCSKYLNDSVPCGESSQAFQEHVLRTMQIVHWSAPWWLIFERPEKLLQQQQKTVNSSNQHSSHQTLVDWSLMADNVDGRSVWTAYCQMHCHMQYYWRRKQPKALQLYSVCRSTEIGIDSFQSINCLCECCVYGSWLVWRTLS